MSNQTGDALIAVRFEGQQAIRDAVSRLAGAASDLKPGIEAATEYLSEKLGESFDNTERFESLADSTKKARRRQVAKGKSLVKNEDTPLRAFDDSIRKAAMATTAGVIGSAYQEGDGFNVIGIDEEGTKYMKRVLLGDDTKPERDAMELPEADLERAEQIMEDSVLQRLNGTF